MAKLSEEYLDILEDIGKHISNEEEKKYVLKKIGELSARYLDIIDRISEMGTKRVEELEDYQGKLEKRLAKLTESVNLIKNDIYEEDSYDFEIVCPYCNHEFVADVEAELKEEVECPKCHNTIELDWDDECEEEAHSGCSGNCHSCGHFEEEFGMINEEDADNKEENDEDDDM